MNGYDLTNHATFWEHYIKVNGETVELFWDDSNDPTNSVGWVARDTPVGPNVAERYAEIQAMPEATERWEALLDLRASSLAEAVAEARVIFA